MSDERIVLASGHGLEATKTSAPNLVRHVARYKFATGSIGASKRVLDCACGSGYGSWLLWQAGNEVVGLDANDGAIEYARESYPGPTFAQRNVIEGLGYWEPFDAVVSVETLEHLEDPQRAVDELKRVAKPDAVFVLSSPINRSGVTGPSETNPYHIHEFTASDFMDFCERNFADCMWWWQSGSDNLSGDTFHKGINGRDAGFAIARCEGAK